MNTWWQLLQAWWSDDDTGSGIPTVGAPGSYVPVLNTTTREVTWQASTATVDILVDEETGEILVDEETGEVLYDG